MRWRRRERTETVRLLLARGTPVPDAVLALAERALTEPSDWTPHHSRELIELLEQQRIDNKSCPNH